MSNKTGKELLADQENKGFWVAACNGTETPFVIRGVRVLYCYNTGSKRHAYFNLDTDVELSTEEFEALRNG